MFDGARWPSGPVATVAASRLHVLEEVDGARPGRRFDLAELNDAERTATVWLWTREIIDVTDDAVGEGAGRQRS